ncbi:MAG: hypothetical protein SOT28_01570 [Fusicatenibacter sp.]|nr:hypothetical protein [Lachnospiraceae bacterium]MDY2936996.1 hypothetical protein [Fusicatenibacter sp.]
MNHTPYAEETYYLNVFHGTAFDDDVEELTKYLKQASRHIDSLTYNRIVDVGFENLTPFQQELVQEVCCQQAEFEFKNREVFDMILNGYSINGVSMQFGESWNVTIQKGIPMRRDVYEQLNQTGLCCRLLR